MNITPFISKVGTPNLQMGQYISVTPFYFHNLLWFDLWQWSPHTFFYDNWIVSRDFKNYSKLLFVLFSEGNWFTYFKIAYIRFHSVIRSWSSKTLSLLKGVCHEIFCAYFFHDSKPSGPLINTKQPKVNIRKKLQYKMLIY